VELIDADCCHVTNGGTAEAFSPCDSFFCACLNTYSAKRRAALIALTLADDPRNGGLGLISNALPLPLLVLSPVAIWAARMSGFLMCNTACLPTLMHAGSERANCQALSSAARFRLRDENEDDDDDDEDDEEDDNDDDDDDDDEAMLVLILVPLEVVFLLGLAVLLVVFLLGLAVLLVLLLVFLLWLIFVFAFVLLVLALILALMLELVLALLLAFVLALVLALTLMLVLALIFAFDLLALFLPVEDAATVVATATGGGSWGTPARGGWG
jgi:hypothetical protein